ncbi:MAG: hypothetical protein MUC36_25230 [Planctomycetes bacterium]|jgi:hypothetical protein|nr:hypothetical protein [Planctomycetota bacterium]
MRTLLLSCLFCLPLLAQEPEVVEPPPPPPPETNPISQPDRPKQNQPAGRPPVVVTLKFPGGTLGEFVAMLRQLEPKANVMVAAAAADAVLPALELRGAGLSQVLQSACAVAESHLEIRVKETRGEGEAVFAITARALPPAQDPFAARAQRTKVFSLSRLLEGKENAGLAPATVLSAIETAVGGPDLLTALRYHKESGVLIVRGTDEQIGVCSELLLQLERDAEARRRQENTRKGIPNEPPVAPDARK